MKKILLLLCLLITIFPYGQVIYAEDSLENQITDAVEEQVGNLDLSDIEQIFSNLSDEEKQIFGSGSFLEKLKLILSGEFSNDSQSLLQIILNLICNDLVTYLPLMAMIIAVAILFSFVGQMRGALKSNAIGNILHFASYGIIIMLIMNSVLKCVSITQETIINLGSQMQAIFPILLTVLTAVGGNASVSIYQPAFAIASGSILTLFSKILLPLFLFSLAFTIISNLSTTTKFDKFSSFFSSTFKWVVGFVFTIFFGFIAIQGITAGSFDGISIRTAKYTIKSSVPIIGGYLSDGFNLIMASSVLVKNAVGASGLILILACVIVPVVQIAILSLCLKLTSAILEPIADGKITSFVSSISKSITMLVVVILAVSFLYFLLIGLVMSTANFI